MAMFVPGMAEELREVMREELGRCTAESELMMQIHKSPSPKPKPSINRLPISHHLRPKNLHRLRALTLFYPAHFIPSFRQ